MKKQIAILMALLVLTMGLAGCKDNGGSGSGSGSLSESGSISSSEAQSDAAGWWVRPEGYRADGGSLVDRFRVEGETAQVHNALGEPVTKLDCAVKDGTFLLQMPDGEAVFTLTGNEMRSEGGVLEFVRTEDPGFEDTNFDGRWYLAGDPEQGYYEISGKTFQHMVPTSDGPKADESGELNFTTTREGIDGKVFPERMELTADDLGLVLTPNGDRTILYASQSFEYHIYVHEDALKPDMVEAYSIMNDLMNTNLMRNKGDNQMAIVFHPTCFFIAGYSKADLAGDDPEITPSVGPDYGTWELLDNKTIRLSYENGSSEDLVLPAPGEALHVGSLDLDFRMDSASDPVG